MEIARMAASILFWEGSAHVCFIQKLITLSHMKNLFVLQQKRRFSFREGPNTPNLQQFLMNV